MDNIRAPKDKDEEEWIKYLIGMGFGKSLEDVVTEIAGKELPETFLETISLAIEMSLDSGQTIEIRDLVESHLNWQESLA